MARRIEKQRALELRQKEMSYSQIKKVLGVSKSTLSGWLKDYPLSEKRIRELRDSEQKIEKCRETKRKKREARLNVFYNEEKSKILPMSKKELYLAGLFLYWGEGSKSQNSAQLLISNTDPVVIKFFIYWAEESFNVPREKFSVQLHLYSDMDIDKEIGFWSKELKIEKKQFIRPYIKESLSSQITHKGAFGHGTCNLRIGDVRLFEKVIMGLKVIRDCHIS